MSIDHSFVRPIDRAGSVRDQGGFTLTELLVGVAIGLIGIAAMFQVLTLWDRTKRSTAAGGDAQVVGTVGFFRLERDVKQAGMGFGQALVPVAGCTVAATTNNTATTVARTFSFPLVPVRIVQGSGGAPDILQVLYGNSSFFSASRGYKDSTAFSKKTASRNGFRVYRNAGGVVERGDVVVVADTVPNCALIEISNDTNADGLTLDHAANSLRFNSAVGTVATLSSGSLFNLGPQPQLNVWAINNGSLVVTDGLYRNTTSTVADGIIDLQAEYGLDTNGDFVVDTWQAADPADWRQVLAIRVALLARSQHYEAPRTLANGNIAYATATAPTLPWTAGNGDALHFVMRNVDGAADTNPQTDANWRNYRYRVYGGVISLRNMIWGVSP